MLHIKRLVWLLYSANTLGCDVFPEKVHTHTHIMAMFYFGQGYCLLFLLEFG